MEAELTLSDEPTKITYEQLLSTRRLYLAEGITDSIKEKLLKAKPCLFEPNGC